jgi:ATP-dependent exoDNAse (exonuclease V) alpha subunit
LADGNRASVGDLIITRSNDRRLRMSATDWVKNGDRWTILKLTGTGSARVRHLQNGCIVTLPHDYLGASVELGYASTVHTAQGVTADTTHGVVTGEESRQQLYTMLTRGRTANHVYVAVVADGDPHAVLQPDNVHLRTGPRAAGADPGP